MAALGPALHVAGHDTGIPMPWAAVDGLPLLRYAIPLRFPAFTFLAAGVMLAMWLARGRGVARWAAALVGLALILPAVGNGDWHTRLTDLPFFTEGGYRGRLTEGDRVLTVPTWGHNMRWQIQADFSFDRSPPATSARSPRATCATGRGGTCSDRRSAARRSRPRRSSAASSARRV